MHAEIQYALIDSNDIRTIHWRGIIARGPAAACLVVTAALATMPAFGGTDEVPPRALEQDRQPAMAQRAPVAQAGAAEEMETLQLDHGPRATTTPWANQQRRLRNLQRQLRSEAAASAGARSSAQAR